MTCEKCGEKMIAQEDEDSWWDACTKCGHTSGHMIKPAFG